MSPLKLYVDLVSQPSRAVLMFLKATNIPFETKIISLVKREQKTPAYKEIHKFGKVPAIDDEGIKIIESIAILRYLTKKYQVADHWYPRDIIQQARVDEFLEWHHIGLRVPVGSYFTAEFLTPLLTGKPAVPSTLERLKTHMLESLENVENIWLKEKPYVSGEKISIADLIGLCEIEQLFLTNFNPFTGRPKLTAWAERLHEDLEPHYSDAHKIFNKIIEKNKASKL